MIDSDTSRCSGYDGAHLCNTCERKAQLQRDAPDVFFWRMAPAIDRGRCVYHIPLNPPQPTRKAP